jgi:hypothetical protein
MQRGQMEDTREVLNRKHRREEDARETLNRKVRKLCVFRR